MSKYDELKRLATLIVEVQTSQDVPISKLFDDFEAAACPETILTLIAENERLEREAKNDLIAYKAVIERQNELRAENAGLRTGYQAYERLNAELKAEVEKVDSDRKACWAEFKVQGRYIDQLKDENDALRKQLPLAEIIWCACGDGYPVNSHGAGLMDANNGVCANCDAAMAHGEQS